MPRVGWTQRGLRDLDRLDAFLRSKNPDAARRAVRAIREAVRILEQHPSAGRRLLDRDEEERELIVSFGSRGGYIARYLVEAGRVVILSVRHGREDGTRGG